MKKTLNLPIKKEYMIAAGAVLIVSIIGFVFTGKLKPVPQADLKNQAVSSYSSAFPIAKDARGYMEKPDATGKATGNYQTSLTIAEIQEFYTKELGSKGLTERKITTSKTDTTLSIVFDGAGEGYSLVVQAVALDKNTRNVNIRYEKL